MTDMQDITDMTEAYFMGLHHADIEKLDGIFHEDMVLKAPGIRRSKQEWLGLVAARLIPAMEGHEFRYKTLSMDIAGDQAMVKVYCPLLGSEFFDFLGFLKEDGQWMIVNKMYADK